MSKVSIEQIRAKLTQNKEKGNGGGQRSSNNGGDNASYAFWNMNEGSSATTRFLPDGNEDNSFPWLSREIIKLPFQGVIGGEYPTDKEVTVQVPCNDMFTPRSCPIVAATKKWWDDPSKKDLARVYWKKKSYITQGFVVASPFVEENLPENPIRRFILNPSLYDIVEQSIMDPEMEDMPTDYINGTDFIIRKTRKGDYANYTSSAFARRSRSLTEAEQAAIETYGLKDLSEFRGRRPDQDELEAIKQMFWDSVDGKPFDADQYGKYFRAFGGGGGGVRQGGGDDVIAQGNARAATTEREPVREAVRETEREPVRETATETRDESNDGAKPARSAHDILASLRNRPSA